MTRHQKYCKEAEEILKKTVERENLFPEGNIIKTYNTDRAKYDKGLKRLLEVIPVELTVKEEQLYNHGWQCLKDYKNKKINYSQLLCAKIKVKKGYNANGEKLDGKTFKYMDLAWPTGYSGINGRIGLLKKLEISENFENE